MISVSHKSLRATTVALCLLLLLGTLWHFQGSGLQSLSRFSHRVEGGRGTACTPSANAKISCEIVIQTAGDNKHAASPSRTAAAAGTVDWSRFAYVQYVTNTDYLCNSVMLFEILNRLHSKADRLLLYPSDYSLGAEDSSIESQLLRKARDEYRVKVQPIRVQSHRSSDTTWAESFTKLLAFNQTQYDRVLIFDSDSTILKPMDELFLLPSAPVGLPRAYWLNFGNRVLSSQLMLIEPSTFEFNRILSSIASADSSEYDMEIVNNLYRDSAMILPHRPYNLVSGEFRSHEHVDYMGNSEETWDPEQVFNEAKFVHFSDWPVPKPWKVASPSVIQDTMPTCDWNPVTGQEDDCRARAIWLGLYSDFAKRRKEVCGIDLE